MVKLIQTSKIIRHLIVAGSPNQAFSDMLFSMLAFNQSIQSLEVNIEWMPVSSYWNLSQSLRENQTLQELHIKGCKMTNTDMELIVDGLGNN